MFVTHPRFTIRPIDRSSPEDLSAVLDVYRQCEDFLALGPVPHASLQMVLADLEHSAAAGGDFCGILDPTSGRMLGIIDVVFTGFEGQQNAADLSLLMIGKPYRGQGLGELVVRAFESEIARRAEVSAIHSGVQVNNPVGIRFWLRMGYKIVSEAEEMPDTTICYQLLKVVSEPA